MNISPLASWKATRSSPLNIYPEQSQTLDPLQSMPAKASWIAFAASEKVAGGEKIEAIGIGFPESFATAS